MQPPIHISSINSSFPSIINKNIAPNKIYFFRFFKLFVLSFSYLIFIYSEIYSCSSGSEILSSSIIYLPVVNYTSAETKFRIFISLSTNFVLKFSVIGISFIVFLFSIDNLDFFIFLYTPKADIVY